jgi:murein DD-endopeptidase MepM/ murein hydrolase activator NlpD
MGEQRIARYRVLSVAAAIAATGAVASCAWGPPDPAPVVLKGAPLGFAAEGAAVPGRAAHAVAEARRIFVRPGQSLGGIAHAYHVPERTIIAANNLAPPYKVETGQRLLIPGGSEAPGQPPPLASAQAATPIAHGRPPPEIIPLDGPAPAKPPPPAQNTATLAPPAEPPQAHSPPREPSAAEEANADAPSSPPGASGAALPHGGHFPWPVRGRVLAGYGVASGGTHNDGINIGAPRGTPVAAVDAGIVAYAGNELRGYGNLILVKHASGWITAYAHCDELLVKRGDKVNRGQVIAKVGATGGVGEPQLHFELRRGKRAVDPREFLAPAPSAGEAARWG